jgi:hypothetical protein
MSTHEPSLRSPAATRWGLLGLILAAVALRTAVMAAQWDHLSRDPDGYRLIAENLVQRGAFSLAELDGPAAPTAYRPPLYPLMLAASAWQGRVTAGNIALLHLLAGTLTVVLVLRLARDWDLGRAGWLAAALVACDPILLNQSSEVMTETLATLLVVASLLMLTGLQPGASWRAGLLAGVVLGLTQLCRPTFLIWTVACVGYLFVRPAQRPRWRTPLLVCAGFLLVLLPWVARNQWTLGRPILTTTHGGYTLLLANNRAFYDHLRDRPWRQVWDARELADQLTAPVPGGVQSEIAMDRQLYTLARQTIRDDPRMFMRSTFFRIASLWNPLPHRLSDDESNPRRLLRYGVAIWYAATFLAAAVGLARLGRRLPRPPWLWGLLVVLALTLVHAVYWSNIRMRAPVMPVVYLLAAAASRRSHETSPPARWWRARRGGGAGSRSVSAPPSGLGGGGNQGV